MGHGEDPPPREQTECTPDRDTGEGEHVFSLAYSLCMSQNVKCSNVYTEVCYNTFCNASQVNSKGYKVCGEASSVCGTITINKRKVGILLHNVGN